MSTYIEKVLLTPCKQAKVLTERFDDDGHGYVN